MSEGKLNRKELLAHIEYLKETMFGTEYMPRVRDIITSLKDGYYEGVYVADVYKIKDAIRELQFFAKEAGLEEPSRFIYEKNSNRKINKLKRFYEANRTSNENREVYYLPNQNHEDPKGQALIDLVNGHLDRYDHVMIKFTNPKSVTMSIELHRGISDLDLRSGVVTFQEDVNNPHKSRLTIPTKNLKDMGAYNSHMAHVVLHDGSSLVIAESIQF